MHSDSEDSEDGGSELFCAPCAEGAERRAEPGGHEAKKKPKRCKHADGCDKNAKKGGLCIEHGGTHAPRKCKHADGCDKQAQTGGLCIEHGGTHPPRKCKHADGCDKNAKKGGLCIEHGGTVYARNRRPSAGLPHMHFLDINVEEME